MKDYRVHPTGFLHSTCGMAAALVVAAALVGSEAMAHGTQTHTGYSAEDVYCPHAQSSARDALKSACKKNPQRRVYRSAVGTGLLGSESM